MEKLKEFLELQKKRRRRQILDNILFVFLVAFLVWLMNLAWQIVYYFIFKYG